MLNLDQQDDDIKLEMNTDFIFKLGQEIFPTSTYQIGEDPDKIVQNVLDNLQNEDN